jgi:DNA-directed RNA polymerase specialized sigma24 family protein
MGATGKSASPAVPRSDTELISAIASGDAAAFVTLHERHVQAARNLASRLAPNVTEVERVVAETFTRLHDLLRRSDGPRAALRPFLLTAVRQVAQDRRQRAEASAAQPPKGQSAKAEPAEAEPAKAEPAKAEPGNLPEIPGFGRPEAIDPDIAELESAPLAQAFLSLPEPQRATLWHTVIEETSPELSAAILGVTPDGLAEVSQQARAALYQAYLKLYRASRTVEECQEVAGKLDQHLEGITRGADEAMVQRHLRSCRDCRGATIELAGLSRSLRSTVAPIFLGAAAGAYLALTVPKASTATDQILGGLGWMRQAPRWLRRAPHSLRRAPRQQQLLAGGVFLVAAFGATGLALTLASNAASPPGASRHQVAAAVAPPTPGPTVPSAQPAPTHSRRHARTRPAQPSPSPSPSPSAAPKPTPSPSPSPSPAPTTPAPTPTPVPTPSPPPHRHRHHPPPGS